MSYDINFWRQDRELSMKPNEIYVKLSGVQVVEGLSLLPVDEILAKLKGLFPDFNSAEEFLDIKLPNGAIEVSWSKQHFRFDIRGEFDQSISKIVKLMADNGCPMYDPQVDKRYDENGGLCVKFPLPDLGDAAKNWDIIKEGALKALADGQDKQKNLIQGCLIIVGLAAMLAFAVYKISRMF